MQYRIYKKNPPDKQTPVTPEYTKEDDLINIWIWKDLHQSFDLSAINWHRLEAPPPSH